jgi:hypothetical protein
MPLSDALKTPVVVFLLLSLFGPALYAQAPADVTFAAQIAPRTVAAGATFEVSFRLDNAEGRRFRPPAFPATLRVVGGPAMTYGSTFINGRMSKSMAWTYELQAAQPGTYVVGPATVVVDGRTLRSQPQTVVVGPPPPAGQINVPPDADERLFIAAELDRPSALPGQQVTYRIKLYTLMSVESADILELPDFQGFFHEEKRRFDTRVTTETLRGQQYAVKVLHEIALFAQDPGARSIGTARVKIGVERGGPMAPLLGPAPVLLETQPLELEVRPLPDSLPANFTGGVGQYEWTVKTDRDSVRTGEAITLTLAVRGNGDPNRFNLPPLVLPASLETFTPKIANQENYENGEEFVHDQTVEYVILPSEPGRYSLLPELVYYDPDSNRFIRRVPADSIVFSVSPGANYGKDVPLPDTSGQISAPNQPGTPWQKFRDRLRLGDDTPWWLALLVLPVLLLLFLMGRAATPKKRVVVADPKPVDQVKLAREQLAALQVRARTDPPRVFYDELLKALHHYLSARLNIPPGQLTKPVVQAYLADRRAPAQITDTILRLWQTCEELVFAPASPSAVAPAENAWRETEAVVQELERYLGKA